MFSFTLKKAFSTAVFRLKDEFAGYRRLADGKYRVIYLSFADKVECLHAGRRKTVYEEFKTSGN